MKNHLVLALSTLVLALFTGVPTAAQEAVAETTAAPESAGLAESTENPRLMIETSKGNLEIELFPDKAPKTVENFLAYVDSGFYNGTIFHRVMPGFMVQAGGFTADLTKKKVRSPVENESKNGLSNERGTLAMARMTPPHTATSQFFVNLVHNTFLDQGHTPAGRTVANSWGYAVFGKVTSGMEVADSIAQVPRGPGGPNNRMQNVPQETVTIHKIRRLEKTTEE